MPPPFVPSHTAPPGGLTAWAAPDPRALTVATLEPRVEMRILQRRGDWAQIECSNGWTAWVDARGPVPVPPPAMTVPAAAPAPMYSAPPPSYSPSPGFVAPPQSYSAPGPSYGAPPPHAAPPAQYGAPPPQYGAPSSQYETPAAPYPPPPAYSMPSPAYAPQSYPPPQGHVPLLRKPLIRLGRYAVTLAELIPAVLIIVGSLLPWLGGVIGSGTSFDVPVLLLFGTQPGATDIKVGYLLMVAVLVGVFVPLAAIRLMAFGLALAICALYVIQLMRALGEVGGGGEVWSFVGFGVYVTAGAALLGCLACLRPRRP